MQHSTSSTTHASSIAISEAQELRPSVVDFKEPQSYLLAHLNWRKTQLRNFSISRWAKELRFSSRSFLRLVLVGQRNLTESTIHRLIQNIAMSVSEQEHFINIVKLQQAKSEEEKKFYAQKLQSSVISKEIQGSESSTYGRESIPGVEVRIPHDQLSSFQREVEEFFKTLHGKFQVGNDSQERVSVRINCTPFSWESKGA